MAGKKTASCSLKQAYLIENEPLPEVGRLTVVLNWAQEPVCIVRLTQVSTAPFNEVTEDFARAEGEGDASYT
ncbi:ASCH domain-containing protein [Thaumasiovibrio subtropicus]|uniref:ASCH domain-containing protein n=1 Tax=Thaumasiovibrio subtropicus TaxID=1891207 RepID=UPI0039C8E096